MNEEQFCRWLIETERVAEALAKDRQACQQYGDIIKQAIQTLEQL